METFNYRALGIDQGYANCGYAVVEWLPEASSPTILAVGTIKTKSSEEMGHRLLTLKTKLTTLATEHEVQLLGCEKLFFNPTSGGRNKSAAIVNASMATGMCFLISGELNVPIKDYTPGTIKKVITGSGRADKAEVEAALVELAEGQGFKLKDDHSADALGIAMTAIRNRNANEAEEPEAPKKKRATKKKPKAKTTPKEPVEATATTKSKPSKRKTARENVPTSPKGPEVKAEAITAKKTTTTKTKKAEPKSAVKKPSKTKISAHEEPQPGEEPAGLSQAVA